MKIYIVIEGRQKGIYSDWDTCSEQIKGHKGAKFKSFKLSQMTEAQGYLIKHQVSKNDMGNFGIDEKLYDELFNFDESNLPRKENKAVDIANNFLAVDGGTHGNNSDGTSTCEFQIYDFAQDKIIYASKEMVGTNNIAEFLAIVKAFAFIYKSKEYDKPIFSDSQVAIKWVNERTCNTKLFDGELNEGKKETKKAVDAAIKFLNQLHQANIKFDLRKWDTEEWGENPADYGRK